MSTEVEDFQLAHLHPAHPLDRFDVVALQVEDLKFREVDVLNVLEGSIASLGWHTSKRCLSILVSMRGCRGGRVSAQPTLFHLC